MCDLFMNARNSLLSIFILSLTFLANQNAMAGKVYKWTDEDGSVHFSDVPPKDISIIETRDFNILDDNNADPEKYSIINQLDRMAERRRQITEERLARKRLQIEEKRLAQESEIIHQNEQIITQVYESRPYFYAYPQYYSYRRPHYYRQRQHAYYQPRHSNPAIKRSSSKVSGSRIRSNTHHPRF
jgi:hypothetical protein